MKSMGSGSRRFTSEVEIPTIAGFPSRVTVDGMVIRSCQRVLAEARKTWDGKSPLFLSVGLFALQLKPSDVVRLVGSLGPEFKVVRADHYFALLRQAQGLKP